MLTSKLIEEEHTIDHVIHIDGESVLRITTRKISDPHGPLAEVLLSREFENMLQPGTLVRLKRFSSNKTYLSLQVGDMVFDL
ncbi:MAG: hypothetical protein EB059_04560 [Alphaproteobacteria bacterium]|nr:hypothetical protein [Alphaproteobacteria bacterium]